MSAEVLVLTREKRHLEDSLHKAVVNFLRWALPPDACWLPFPNGGWRWKSEAQRMQGAGQVRAGVPDLEIVHRGRAIFVELKTPDGRLAPSQKQMHETLTRAGAAVHVCRSEKDVQAVLLEAGVQLRGRIA